jgi:DNA-binding transcriptional ArsR family regulator
MTIEPPTGAVSISRDTAFEILTNPRRRYALSYLRSKSGTVSIGELAEAVAAWEQDTNVELVSSKERKSVYTSLYQTHLPKMADAGVIVYDRQRGQVRLSDTATELDKFVNPPSKAGNWSRYYLALAVIGGVAILCNLLGMYPFTLLNVLAYAALLLVAFTLLSAVNLEHVRQRRSQKEKSSIGDDTAK